MKRCILQENKVCNACGACDDRCELDPEKVCDNCFRCLEVGEAYSKIMISAVYPSDEYMIGQPKTLFDPEDGFLPESFPEWKKEMFIHAKTLPLAFGMRVRRAHKRR